jgi:hypothetical protein
MDLHEFVEKTDYLRINLKYTKHLHSIKLVKSETAITATKSVNWHSLSKKRTITNLFTRKTGKYPVGEPAC